MSRILYIPTCEFLVLPKYVLGHIDDERIHGHARSSFWQRTDLPQATKIWEQSEACVNGKYPTADSFIKFLSSPLTRNTMYWYRKWNNLPDDLDVSLFEVIHDSRSPNCKN